jgi:hypothetical protein
MRHLLRNWDRRNNRLCREGMADCEAFLRGRLAERLEARGVGVPTWAWTNLLAHGRDQDLRDDRPPPWTAHRAVNDRWHRARSYLATEVLILARAHEPLVVLQERILRPLELDLAVRQGTAAWGPNELVAHVCSILDAHRALERRTSRHGARDQG